MIMVYCCVPFCKSESGKNSSIKLYEFPSDLDTREKWILIISRMDEAGMMWRPNDRSSVCSIHFKESDFRVGKRRVLKKGVVPSNFPSYVELKIINNKRKNPLENGENQLNIKKEKSLDEYENQRMETCNTEITQEIRANSVRDPSIVVMTNEEIKIENNSDIEREPYKCQNDNQEKLQKKVRNQSVIITRVKRKTRLLLTQIQAQKIIIDKLKKYEKLENQLESASAEGNMNAIFLKEQFAAFVERKHRWNERVLRCCILWRFMSPKGYEFARKSKLLKLPSRATISRCVESNESNIGRTETIKKDKLPN